MPRRRVGRKLDAQFPFPDERRKAMTDERLDSAERDAVTSQPVVEVLSEVDSPPIPVPANAMTVYVTLPPGSAGSAPHRHPGPAFGFVIEGEMIFEVEGEPERVVKAGESFWEPGGDVIH